MGLKRQLLRYVMFAGIPYFIARRIEKYFWANIDSKSEKKIQKELEDKSEFDKLSKPSKDAVDNRGGFLVPVVSWLTTIIMKDLAVKVAIGGAVSATIWAETADNAAAQLVKYGSAILAAPGKKFVSLYNRIRRIDPQHSMDIRQILFDTELTNEDKLKLLKIKVESVLKNLKGSKRKQFILFLIATLFFSVNGNFALFAWFMDRLRALIGTGDDVDTIRESIIEVYKEYNAPLPRDLAEVFPEEIIHSITNID